MDEKYFEILDNNLDYGTLVKTEDFKKLMCTINMSLSRLIAGSNFTITLIGDLDCIVMYENETVLQVIYDYTGSNKQIVSVRVKNKDLQKEVREKLFCGNKVILKIKGLFVSGSSQYNNDFELVEIVDASKRGKKFKHYICKECGYDFGYDTEKHTTCLCCGGKLKFR